MSRYVDRSTTAGQDPIERARLAQLGFSVAPGAQLDLSDFTSVETLPDAYVLCFTEKFDPNAMSTFGRSCVEIQKVDRFFRRLSHCVSDELGISQAISGSVIYGNPQSDYRHKPAGPIGFVKRAEDRYVQQREFRMIWIPKDLTVTIKPRFIDFRSIGSLAKIFRKP